MESLIPEFTERGIIYSIGHSDATFEQAQGAVAAGATMVTHMFNAMRPFGHRDPNIFGLLGQSSSPVSTPPSSPRTTRPSSILESPKTSRPGSPRTSRRSTPRSSLSISSTPAQLSAPKLAEPETGKPFFGLIADGIHLHSSSIQIAHAAHPSGTILVTDAMQLAGCANGTYDWTNGERIIKKGPLLTLETNGRIAGSAIELIDCINNFKKWTNCSVPEALACVTSTPARMLGEGVVDRKGGLKAGMDADLVILDEGSDGTLMVDEVWKFGSRVV
jgi:N-acetylglucosamine-6-phosphate deacetylase